MAASEISRAYQRAYRMRNLEKVRKYAREYTKRWRDANPEKSRIALRKSYHKDVEKSRRLARESRIRAKLDPERIERMREYARNKMQRLADTDPNHVTKKRLRTRICMALKRQATNKSESTMTLIGCSIDDFRTHIESLWKPMMTWENYGRKGWHVDHKRPCADFDLTDPEQQKLCFHFTNLQPLWWHENLSKGCRVK